MFYMLLLKLVNSKISILDTFYFQVQEKDKFEAKKILNQKD